MTARRILRLSGQDTREFLQGLITNDVKKLSDGLVYAAMLTPQGKYLADFFLVPDGDSVLLDVSEGLADMLGQRLAMYKLRANVEIDRTELHMHRGLGEVPSDGYPDPRHPEMGWRAYRDKVQEIDVVDWDALRVANSIPESGLELTPDTFILEVGFERLHGVDFRKGCYVGQEVTARMKHKTELRKGLARVTTSAIAPFGSDITADGKPVGTLYTQSGDRALAYLRFNRAQGDMMAEDAKVVWDNDPSENATR